MEFSPAITVKVRSALISPDPYFCSPTTAADILGTIIWVVLCYSASGGAGAEEDSIREKNICAHYCDAQFQFCSWTRDPRWTGAAAGDARPLQEFLVPDRHF